jgi:ABC-2 type transport system permease protein
MSGAAVVLHQFRFDQKIFWRNPAAVFFTALLPLLFLFLLATIFKNTHISDVDVKGATYYVPAILTLAVVSATTVKLATNLPAEREAGQLKRVRGTPLPPAACSPSPASASPWPPRSPPRRRRRP